MKIKLSWGTGIVTAIGLFMTVTAIIGITFMTQKVDLVTDNYYEKELQYQNQIDKVNRTNLLGKYFEIEYEGNSLSIFFNDFSAVKEIKGEIIFYRPSDSIKDFKIPISLTDIGSQSIDIESIEKGYWKVQVNWTMDNQEYFSEKILLIN